MAEFNRNILLAILAAIILIGIIYYLNKNDNRAVPNEGVITNNEDIYPMDQMDQMDQMDLMDPMQNYRDGLNSPSKINTKNNIVDDLVAQYDMNDLISASDPMATNHQVFDDYVPKKYLNKDKTHYLLSDDDDEEDFVYKKQKFTRKTQDDINDLFDVSKLLPQENEEGWFDTSTLQNAKKIKGTHMIHPKKHMGINTVGTRGKNPSLDMRGDVPNDKIPISPWGNSTIDRVEYPNGLCQIRDNTHL